MTLYTQWLQIQAERQHFSALAFYVNLLTIRSLLHGIARSAFVVKPWSGGMPALFRISCLSFAESVLISGCNWSRCIWLITKDKDKNPSLIKAQKGEHWLVVSHALDKNCDNMDSLSLWQVCIIYVACMRRRCLQGLMCGVRHKRTGRKLRREIPYTVILAVLVEMERSSSLISHREASLIAAKTNK